MKNIIDKKYMLRGFDLKTGDRRSLTWDWSYDLNTMLRLNISLFKT